MKYTAISILALTLLLQTRARAQIGEAGAITTRSDVKMSVEGAMGTGGDRLDALAAQLSTPLAEVKQCYGQLVKRDPGVIGTLHVDLVLPEKGNMRVTPAGTGYLSQKMRVCVQGAFQKMSTRDIERPAEARLALVLSNSAAETVPEVRAREEEASRVEVKTDAEGQLFSEGQSLDSRVEYRVSAAGKDASEVIERVHTAVRDALPSLFDCRRKSAKDGSPEGELKLDVWLGGKSSPKVEVRSNTVNSERAPFCVDRAMTRGLAGLGWGKAKVELRFAP